jgi:PAS domain S-box-containing protein
VYLSESQRTAFRIVFSYLLAGTLWILIFRYWLPAAFGPSPLSAVEGWVFIILTGLYIYKAIELPLEKHQQIARALRHNEEKYRTLVEEINEVIFVIDQFGKITYISPAVYQLTGFRPEDMIGHLFLEYIHPADEDVVVNAFKRRLQNEVAPLQYRIVKRDGNYRWVRSLSKLFKDVRHGTGIRGVLMDITDLVEKDRALVQSEARWRSVVEQAPDYIITTDLQGKIDFVNRNFFSVPEKLVVGQFIYDLVPQSEMKKLYQAIQIVNASGEQYRFEIQLEIDEQKRCYFIRTGPIKRGKEMVGLTFIATDVTKRKRSEQELEKYRAHLQQLVTERTQKLKDVHHELDVYNQKLREELQPLIEQLMQSLQAMPGSEQATTEENMQAVREIARQLEQRFRELQNIGQNASQKSGKKQNS